MGDTMEEKRYSLKEIIQDHFKRTGEKWTGDSYGNSIKAINKIFERMEISKEWKKYYHIEKGKQYELTEDEKEVISLILEEKNKNLSQSRNRKYEPRDVEFIYDFILRIHDMFEKRGCSGDELENIYLKLQKFMGKMCRDDNIVLDDVKELMGKLINCTNGTENSYIKTYHREKWKVEMTRQFYFLVNKAYITYYVLEKLVKEEVNDVIQRENEKKTDFEKMLYEAHFEEKIDCYLADDKEYQKLSDEVCECTVLLRQCKDKEDKEEIEHKQSSIREKMEKIEQEAKMYTVRTEGNDPIFPARNILDDLPSSDELLEKAKIITEVIAEIEGNESYYNTFDVKAINDNLSKEYDSFSEFYTMFRDLFVRYFATSENQDKEMEEDNQTS